MKGKNINSIHRAADMLCLGFGDSIKKKIGKKTREVSEYALHVQCPWAFYNAKEVILASGDIYEPYDETVGEDWEYDQKEYEQKNIFDYKTEQLKCSYDECVVTDIQKDKCDNLKIQFQNGWTFRTFISCSRKREFWRFLNFHTGEHIVVYEEEEYVDMEWDELKYLDKMELFAAISERMEYKLEQKKEDYTNKYVRIFYELETFLKEMDFGGVNQYFCSPHGKDANHLKISLEQVAFSDLARMYAEFIERNNINLNEAKNGNFRYFESLVDKVSFDEFDDKFFDIYEEKLKNTLVEYVVENIDYLK